MEFLYFHHLKTFNHICYEVYLTSPCLLGEEQILRIENNLNHSLLLLKDTTRFVPVVIFKIYFPIYIS